MTFNTSVHRLGTIAVPPQEDVRQMVPLYRADMDFARSFGGAALQPFLDQYKPIGLRYISIDVKVHMLKPGWFPCIPGWHLDDFWRPTGGQPVLNELDEHGSQHTMVVFGDSSLTEFLHGPVTLEAPPAGFTGNVYGWYNEIIEAKKLPRFSVEEGVVHSFTHNDFHRGVAATKSGWRAFIRLTESDHREPKNEIRSQANVYIPHTDLTRGW